MPKAISKAQQQKAEKKVFYIDYSIPANDGLFNYTDFEKFLQDQIKVEGKKGQLGDKVSVACKENENKILVQATGQFPKRYLKYLTKKFLKKEMMRNWMRVVATQKNTYTIKYFNFDPDEE